MNIPRTITIKPVLNGYVVRVGCQSLAFTSREDLLNNLKSYLSDPTKTETAYLTGCMHRDLVKAPTPLNDPLETACEPERPYPIRVGEENQQGTIP